MESVEEYRNRVYENGDRVNGLCGEYCAHCSYAFGGSGTSHMYLGVFLNGKVYHPDCYITAVDLYIADRKLKDFEEAHKQQPTTAGCHGKE